MLGDFLKAIKNTDGWLYLAWFDIKAKYRRTVFGPFWIVLVTLISIGAIGTVSAILFKNDILAFLPYVACGIVSWAYITSMITESCTAFVASAFIIQNIKVNLITICLRTVTRSTFVFLHSLIVVLLSLIICKGFSVSMLVLIPAVLILAINGLLVTIYVGFLATRFRDITQIIQTVFSILIFTTPVMWKKEMMGRYDFIVQFNPFTHFIALIRDPLLGDLPSYENISVILGITLLNIIIGSYIYKKFNKRLIFWL